MPNLDLTLNKKEIILNIQLSRKLVMIIRLQLSKRHIFNVLKGGKIYSKLKKTTWEWRLVKTEKQKGQGQ